MQTSLAWLNDYLDRAADADEADRALTRVGFPLDGREDVTTSAGQRDTALDVEITSNRPDCLCHLGLARELAAATDRALQPPDITLPNEGDASVETFTRVDNDAADLCPVYTARIITGVKVGPSPQWLVDRLEAAGLRSVNNVVDVTNFVLLELAQPLHAFDLHALNEQRIVVRRAAKSEPFTAIDGSAHALRDDMLVIADAQRPVAIAGVMGGLDTEVGDNTTAILLESAIFDPLSVRRTSRALKLASDSSFRFERGVDPRGVEMASRRAAQLIVQLAGGTLAQGVIRAGEPEPEPRTLALRSQRCRDLLGVELGDDTQHELLERLNLSPKREQDRIVCTVPTYRLDLQREVDLIEEVGRLHGFDDVPTHERIALNVRPVQDTIAARRQLGRTLTAHGFHETITFSLVAPNQAERFLPDSAEPVHMHDAGRRAEPTLRPSLLPSLLICRKANQDHGNTNVRLFETAASWSRQCGEIRERRTLALLCDAADGQLAVRELRGTIEELIERLGGAAARQAVTVEPADAPNYSAAVTVKLHDQPLGALGLIASETRDAFDLKTSVAGAELTLDPLIALYPPDRAVRELPRYPAIERDLSVIVAESVAWREIERAVHDAQPPLLEALSFLGTYRGKPIEKGSKSVSFRMLFRDPDKTLRHDEVDPQVESVVTALRERVGVELRA
ncbi:MAG: phenylalanine--tRNA ligase subunit beta [Phycisphaeraceae bacterium]